MGPGHWAEQLGGRAELATIPAIINPIPCESSKKPHAQSDTGFFFLCSLLAVMPSQTDVYGVDGEGLVTAG